MLLGKIKSRIAVNYALGQNQAYYWVGFVTNCRNISEIFSKTCNE